MMALIATSCATVHTRVPPLGASCAAAGQEAAQALRAYDVARAESGACDRGAYCDNLRYRMERLLVDCGSDPDVLFANAVLAFENKNLGQAQKLLDQALDARPNDPGAAALRGRIALEGGNIPFALRFLEQKVGATGDHSGLRETYASALFLAGRLDEAQRQLDIAGKLGAPTWRIAYGQGLIAEAQGRFTDAKQLYEEAVRSKPDWSPAASRLRALTVSGNLPH
jgi:predicted Zn-dependent protease